jgi:hypothetical protein
MTHLEHFCFVLLIDCDTNGCYRHLRIDQDSTFDFPPTTSLIKMWRMRKFLLFKHGRISAGATPRYQTPRARDTGLRDRWGHTWPLAPRADVENPVWSHGPNSCQSTPSKRARHTRTEITGRGGPSGGGGSAAGAGGGGRRRAWQALWGCVWSCLVAGRTDTARAVDRLHTHPLFVPYYIECVFNTIASTRARQIYIQRTGWCV